MSPFECDLCVFRAVTERNPSKNIGRDLVLSAVIRRCSLDAFWSRATSTVLSNAQRMRKLIQVGYVELGMEPPLFEPALRNLSDCGDRFTAHVMVKNSMQAGRYSESHLQFDTIRKLKATLANYHLTVSDADSKIPFGIASDSGMFLRFATGTASSVWMDRFIQGCRKRMGQDWRPDRAMSIKLVLSVLKAGQEVIAVESSSEKVADTITFCSYLVICYVLSLRGPEGLLVSLAPLIDQDGLGSLLQQGSSLGKSLLIVPLLGKVKGESHRREHVLPCVEVTSSGINVRRWLDLLIETRKLTNQKEGPAITKSDGELFCTAELNEIFHDLLWMVFQKDETLFDGDIKSRVDIEKWFSVFRSIRRTSDSKALAEGVASDDIDAVNRWSLKERAKGRKATGRKLRHYYADMPRLLTAHVRYTFAM